MNDLIGSLTLPQKAALLQGWTSWNTLDLSQKGIPSAVLSDGPHGIRRTNSSGLRDSIPATCFPTAATMANSWDPELGEEMGRALGEEAAAQGVNVLLGPGLNLKRSPLCGRNFEYFSEDPLLAGKMAAAYIRGIQSKGIGACPKHFAANSQETNRLSCDSVMDERTLRELYLTGFEIAVTESHPKTIMASYNLVNGSFSCENKHLLTEILRGEWGFDGFVVSDWGAENNHVEGIRSGMDLAMPFPGTGCAIEVVKAVEAGTLSEEVLDQRLRELLPVILETAHALEAAPKEFDREAHHELARKCAAESIVLLENNGILPLKSGTRTAVIGEFAESPRYQGAGSSIVKPTKLDSLLSCLKGRGLYLTGYAKGYTSAEKAPNYDLIRDATQLAMGADAVLLCIGLDDRAEAEGRDRKNLNLPEPQAALLKSVCQANANVVLVLSGGSPFLIPDYPQIRAVIHGYLGGQAGARAMADALLGAVNPSGKLSESWPLSLESVPCSRYYPGTGRTAEYREGLYVGYRYYETVGVPVRYPFGYGLSYTDFAYSDLTADRRSVRFTLENTGSLDGAEVAQVYVSCKNGRVFRPARELKAFRKVFLKAGERKTVTIPLDDRTFRYFDVNTGRFETESADYEILVGSSSTDTQLSAVLTLEGTRAESPYESLPCYESGRIEEVPDEQFRSLLGRPIPDSAWTQQIDRNDPFFRLAEAKSPLARRAHEGLYQRMMAGEEKDIPDFHPMMVYGMTMRSIMKSRGDEFNTQMLEDAMDLINGSTVSGLIRMKLHAAKYRKEVKDFRESIK